MFVTLEKKYLALQTTPLMRRRPEPYIFGKLPSR